LKEHISTVISAETLVNKAFAVKIAKLPLIQINTHIPLLVSKSAVSLRRQKQEKTTLTTKSLPNTSNGPDPIACRTEIFENKK
jgi:hypothetical protein